MIISAIRVIVNVKGTQIATRCSLASTVSDNASDDEVFFGTDRQLVRPIRLSVVKSNRFQTPMWSTYTRYPQ